jgi:hypothetical protein
MKNIVCPVLFEESTVTGETFVAMTEDTALCKILAGSVFQLYGAPPHVFHCARVFLYREFLDHWRGREGSIPWPPNSLGHTLLDVFF